MVTMGGDFQFTNANKWFENLDILIDVINNKVIKEFNFLVFRLMIFI